MSFPQTASTDDAFFSTGTGLERVWVVGSDLGCCWAGPQALDVALPCKKNKKEEGPARVSPVAAPMPKSVSL